jgi:RND family efflux transporter MFP subunit
MTGKRLIGIVVVVVLVAGLAVVRLIRVRDKETAPAMVRNPVVVEVGIVRRGVLQNARQFLGDVVGAEDAPLSSRILSQVLRVAVREGDRVRRGQRLIDLDPRELDDAVAASEAGIGAAREAVTAADLALAVQRDATARDKVLVDAGAIAREEWERSQSTVATTKARLEGARAQLIQAQRAADSARTRRGFAGIDAPFEGIVSAKWVNAGDLAAPGKPLLALVQPGALRVRVRVPAELFGELAAGREMGLLMNGERQTITISRVFPAMDATRLATFEADLPARISGLLPGSTASVDLPRAGASGLMVPAAALLEGESRHVVFVVTGGKAQAVNVQVIDRSSADVLVQGALQERDQVVVASASRLMMLADGAPVTVSPHGAK